MVAKMELMKETDAIRRYYLVINENIKELDRYITFSARKDSLGHLRYNHGISKLIMNSDIVIVCDSDGNGPFYAKNRYEDHRTAKVDPDEFAWIKLSSTDIDLV